MSVKQEHLSVMAGPTHLLWRDSRAAPNQGVRCIELSGKRASCVCVGRVHYGVGSQRFNS